MENSLFDAVAKLDSKYWMFFGKSLIIAPYLKSSGNKTILDAGCGTGPMLGPLMKWGNVVGMDASEYALSLAKQHIDDPRVTFKQGDVSHMPFSDGSFDVVTLFDVLYHRGVDNDSSVIKESHRVLKDGGTLIVSDSAFKFLRTSYDKEAHVARRYTLSEMKDKFIKSGFRIKKASYIFFFIFPIVALIRLFGKSANTESSEKEHIFALNPAVNTLMKLMMRVEAMLLRITNLPFGVSVFCVGTKEARV